MSARHRRVSPLMWDDEWFVRQDDAMRNLWQLLLTGPQVLPIPGLQLTGPAALAETLRRGFETVSKLFETLVEEQKIIFDEGFRMVCLPHAPEHNPPDNPNQVIGWWKVWKAMPESRLKYEHISALKASVYSVEGKAAKGLRKAWENTFGTVSEPFPNRCETLREQRVGSREQGVGSREQRDLSPTDYVELETRPGMAKVSQPSLVLTPVEPSKPSEVEQVFEYWRDKLMPRAKLDDKRRRIIGNALKTYGVEELCKAVDGTLLDSHRMGENDRGRKYVDCELVFRNAEKIDPMIALAESSNSNNDGNGEYFGIDPMADPPDPPGTVYTGPPADFMLALDELASKRSL